VRAFGGKAFELGTADCAADCAAAALWLPPGVSPDEEAMGAIVQQSVAEERIGELLAVLEQMGRYHPAEPHWYLPLIGVDPAQQGKGYGSALPQHAPARCDRDGKPAYLESANPANLPLYERHGFEVLGTIQSGASPTLWPMLRKPR
jgi:GNAT superfamily N-acetyltransferase